jgi:hypothetical protein
MAELDGAKANGFAESVVLSVRICGVKPLATQPGDPLWELATRIVEKRTQPGDPVKSILRDLGLLYAGLKRLAPKCVSETPLDQVRKFLNNEVEVPAKARKSIGKSRR